MMTLDWQAHFNRRVIADSDGLHIGDQRIEPDAVLDFGAPIGSIAEPALMWAVKRFSYRTGDRCRPQLAALVFSATHQPYALNTYFPLVTTLDGAGRRAFYRLASDILQTRDFDIRLFGPDRADLTSNMPEVAFFVACHMAEIFFYRRELLKALLRSSARVWLYATPKAFQDSGGVAGGSFNPAIGGLQMVLSRLYEGFDGPTPGVAPFLHEFGHLLDFFDAGKARMRPSSRGVLPGMHPDDRDLFNEEARRLFVVGRGVELGRYNKLRRDGYSPDDPLPIGHPYVFQNNTEFIAGYFEMFFRNPHYFADRNPDLYQSFVLALGQDPRPAWPTDFPFFVGANRGFYESGERVPPSGLTRL